MPKLLSGGALGPVAGLLGAAGIALAVLVSCQPALRQAASAGAPAHHTAGGFKNLHIEDPSKNLFDFLAMKYFGDTVFADHRARAAEVPVAELDPGTLPIKSDNLAVTWLGHSTFLLQHAGVNILTDPIFGDRASPLPFAGPKRYVPHAIDYEKLPRIDYVVISHNHYDHLDVVAVNLLGNQPRYLVPLGLRSWFVENGVQAHRVTEMDWWDKAAFPLLDVQAMPSQHWSARSLFDRRETLWASWLLEIDGKKVWFAGDTGYNPVQFKEIGQVSGGVDLALIPIGGYLPRFFMSPYHVNPEEAIRIHRDIRARRSIGMHWGTFPLTAEGPIDPVMELRRKIAETKLAPGTFLTMAVGETIRQ